MTQTFTEGARSVLRISDRGLIPRERYISREWLDLEFERLWPTVWQFACREEEIPNPGDCSEYEIGRESVLIVRQRDGGVKAFFNACPHRGTRLEYQPEATAELRCPFHGWRFALDGVNTYITDVEKFPPAMVQPDEVCLTPCLVESWAGFLFVNFDRQAAPLLDYLAPIPELSNHHKVVNLRLTSHLTTRVEANWKVVIEAFLEGYHVPATHPGMLQYFDDTVLRHEPCGIHGREGTWNMPTATEELIRPSRRLGLEDYDPKLMVATMVREMAEANMFSAEDAAAAAGMGDIEIPEGMSVGKFFAVMRRQLMAAQGIDHSMWTDDELVSHDDFHFFPNTVGPLNPGNQLLFRARPHATDPNVSYFDIYGMQQFAPGKGPDKVTREEFSDWRDHNWGSLLNQDMENLPRIQAGLQSRGFAGVRLCETETLVAHFERNLERVLLGS